MPRLTGIFQKNNLDALNHERIRKEWWKFCECAVMGLGSWTLDNKPKSLRSCMLIHFATHPHPIVSFKNIPTIINNEYPKQYPNTYQLLRNSCFMLFFLCTFAGRKQQQLQILQEGQKVL